MSPSPPPFFTFFSLLALFCFHACWIKTALPRRLLCRSPPFVLWLFVGLTLDEDDCLAGEDLPLFFLTNLAMRTALSLRFFSFIYRVTSYECKLLEEIFVDLYLPVNLTLAELFFFD